MPSTTLLQEEQFVTFRLADETYAIPILSVEEIIGACEITRVPGSHRDVLGVVNLRGRIVPVVNLRARLGLSIDPEAAGSRIIVVEADGEIVGLIVDSVGHVTRIAPDQIERTGGWFADPERDMTEGVGKLGDDLVILLDVRKTLHTPTRSAA